MGASATPESDLALVEAHRRVFARKPNLRAAYARYHDLILAHCPRGALAVELATGSGHLTEAARSLGHDRWIATDLLPVKDARLRCDAGALPFRSGSVDRIVFVDMLHHLGRPKAFVREAARVLAPRGEVVCVEPWVTAASWPFWRFLHPEGCDLSRDIDDPFARERAEDPWQESAKSAYEGDAGLATLVHRRLAADGFRALGFDQVLIAPFNDYAYLATRGFREGRDAPGFVFHALRATLDELLAPLAPWLGFRALIRWVRS